MKPGSTTRETDRAQVLQAVKRIVGQGTTMSSEEIREEHSLLEDLGCDSLDVVEFTMEIEEEFDVTVPDELAEQSRTIGDVTDAVTRLIAQREA